MTGPRNREAFQAGQRLREAIRQVMLAWAPLAAPLTAARVLQRLSAAGWPVLPSARTVRWHMGAIRLQAQLGCHRGNSSCASDAASCPTGAGDGTHAQILRT
jgi:hypothetical protein